MKKRKKKGARDRARATLNIEDRVTRSLLIYNLLVSSRFGFEYNESARARLYAPLTHTHTRGLIKRNNIIIYSSFFKYDEDDVVVVVDILLFSIMNLVVRCKTHIHSFSLFFFSTERDAG